MATRRMHIHCRDVLAREGIRGVGDEQACLKRSSQHARPKRGQKGFTCAYLADSTITCDDALWNTVTVSLNHGVSGRDGQRGDRMVGR
jgi:hypothetical protein